MTKGYEVDPKAMSFFDHLTELRSVLIQCLLALAAGTAAAWAFSGQLLDLLLGALRLESVQFLSPMEPFNARLRVALSVGLTIALPFVAYRVWSFVVPALRSGERRVIVPSAALTVVLFLVGAAFSIGVLTPMMLSLLMGFGTELAEANLALGPVLAFVFRMTIACAVLFQLPLVLALTTLLGATTPRRLLAFWRYAVVLIFVLAAVLTPGDGPSQVVLAVPLVVLYFLSVLISWIIWRARDRSPDDRISSPAGGPGDDDAASEGSATVHPRTPPSHTRARGAGGDETSAEADREGETR